MSAHAHRAPHTHATSAHARHARTWSGATSPARRTHGTSTGRHRERPRARGPPGTSAPTTLRAMSAHAHRAPHTHAMRAPGMRAPGRARRPRRAAPTGRPRNVHGTTSGTPTGTRAAGDVGPYHAPRHVRTRTPRPHTLAMRAPMVGRDVLGAPLPTGRPRDDIGDAHGYAGRRGRRPLPRTAPCPHTHGARLPCQRIETLMGFRNAVAKSRTRACHAFASFTAPAPLQVAPAQ